jgi:predicted amidohydrolase YtcJ
MPQHDLIVHGGKIVTLHWNSRIAAALGVRDGRLGAVGDSTAVMRDSLGW